MGEYRAVGEIARGPDDAQRRGQVARTASKSRAFVRGILSGATEAVNNR